MLPALGPETCVIVLIVLYTRIFLFLHLKNPRQPCAIMSVVNTCKPLRHRMVGKILFKKR